MFCQKINDRTIKKKQRHKSSGKIEFENVKTPADNMCTIHALKIT